jgi:hypothetical protein
MTYKIEWIRYKWNRSITNNEIELVIKIFQTKKSSELDKFTDEFYLQEELTPVLLKLFHKIQSKPTKPNSFYEVSITLIPKPDKDTT